MDVPFLLVSDMLKQQEQQKKPAINLSFGDSMDKTNTDCNLWVQRNQIIIDCQSLQRFDDYNGSYYNSFGSTIVSKNCCHIWRFQLLGSSPAIIGIIESTAKQQVNGAYFGCNKKEDVTAYSFNTITAQCYDTMNKGQQPIYQDMLQSGKLDEPMIIDMKLDLYNGTMTIANKTNGSQHYGKEIPLFANIDTNKSYKLGIALLGPETINLF